jgi:DNA-binding Lrp family transcriptional regulator
LPAAFIVINAEMGSEEEVLDELKKLEGVKYAYCVYGVYDIIAKVEADSMDKLKDTVTWKVRKMNKVRNTLTMLVTK